MIWAAWPGPNTQRRTGPVGIGRMLGLAVPRREPKNVDYFGKGGQQMIG